MKKLNFGEFVKAMSKHSSEDSCEITGVIVYKSESFNKPYTEVERSYRVSSKNRYFQEGKISNSMFGSCLDGTDQGVRLDWYFGDWKIDYCYLD